ncbi:MAG: diguanylate cyclase [Desulfovibrionaceae bacterium]|nr:diguanylate cyclase [Desulfovibrionaceae bacterium]
MVIPDSTHPPPAKDDERLAAQLRRMPSCSTCTRFLSRILPPLLAAALLFMAVSGHVTLTSMRSDVDRDAIRHAKALTPILGDLLPAGRRDETTDALAAIKSNPAMRRAEVRAPDGALIAAYGREPTPDMSMAEQPILRPANQGTDSEIGRLLIYYDYEEATARFTGRFIGQAIRLLLTACVLFLCGYFAYQTTVGRPLRLLLKSIRDTDAAGRPVAVQWDCDDEIGKIIHAHNTMVRHLADKESALVESEKRHRQLFDNAMVGIFDTRRDGSVRSANATVAEILAYPSVEAMLEANIERHYLDVKERTRLWEKLQEKGSVSNFRTRFRRADGEIIWTNVSGRLNPDGSLSGTIDDVTAQVEAHQALKERDELHRAFFEENKAVMLLHDPQTACIQFVNPAACNFYGYTEKELTSMTLRDLDSMTDLEVFEELKAAANEKRAYFKRVHTLKDGTRRFVEVFTGPVSLGSRQLHYSIIHDVTEKRRLEARLERMATRDQLTGSYNRHAFFERGTKEIARARRFKHPLTLLMLDLDHFKDVNDTHGHAVGDEVLRVFALRCRVDLRETDTFARLGGEEFAAMLVETGEDLAMEAAKRIRRMAASKPIPTSAGDLTVTASIGVATLRDGENLAQLLQRADKGMYAAKAGGRNQIVKS